MVLTRPTIYGFRKHERETHTKNSFCFNLKSLSLYSRKISVNYKCYKHVVYVFPVHGVCLPGRETRFKEANYTRLSEVLDEVVPAVYQLCKDSQFALWGHRYCTCIIVILFAGICHIFMIGEK